MKKLILNIILLSILPLSHSQDIASLEIYVDELRNKKGNLSITLFSREDGFPDDASKAFIATSIYLAKDSSVFKFENLEPGMYAYAILHDEDRNNLMNKNFIGIPREGFGFSNNYRPLIKNPSFKDAAFYLPPGSTRHKITMVYY